MCAGLGGAKNQWARGIGRQGWGGVGGRGGQRQTRILCQALIRVCPGAAAGSGVVGSRGE